MKRIPSTITMMDLRKQPGEVMRAVEHEGREITITKQGKDAARLVPVEEMTTILPDGTVIGPLPLTFRNNLGGHY